MYVQHVCALAHRVPQCRAPCAWVWQQQMLKPAPAARLPTPPPWIKSASLSGLDLCRPVGLHFLVFIKSLLLVCYSFPLFTINPTPLPKMRILLPKIQTMLIMLLKSPDCILFIRPSMCSDRLPFKVFVWHCSSSTCSRLFVLLVLKQDMCILWIVLMQNCTLCYLLATH